MPQKCSVAEPTTDSAWYRLTITWNEGSESGQFLGILSLSLSWIHCLHEHNQCSILNKLYNSFHSQTSTKIIVVSRYTVRCVVRLKSCKLKWILLFLVMYRFFRKYRVRLDKLFGVAQDNYNNCAWASYLRKKTIKIFSDGMPNCTNNLFFRGVLQGNITTTTTTTYISHSLMEIGAQDYYI